MKQINFCHEYYKLKNKRFTTIRGVSNLQLYNVGEIVEIYVNRSVLFIAKVIKLEISQISKISLAALKEDAEYPGFEIKHHVDFMALINSFRRFNKLKSLEDEVLVITLNREEKGE